MLIAIILGIIEGITEFLPISSTGHLILANQFITFSNSDFANTFDIFIQLGAVLAVIIFYRNRLIPYLWQKDQKINRSIIDLWLKTIVAFIPAGFFGLLFGDWIKDHLFTPTVVGSSLLLGGIIIILIERKPKPSTTNSCEKISFKNSLIVGFSQCLGMIPGTSRSAATIITALLLGFNRPTAAEFSFFLSVPTLGIASIYSLFKADIHFDQQEIIWLSLGFISAFLVSYLVISKLIKYIAQNSFTVFGYYRIIIAIIIAIFFYLQ